MALQLVGMLAGPVLRSLGQGAIADKLEDGLRELHERLTKIEDRLERVEKRTEAVVHGWELMVKARQVARHVTDKE